MALLSGDDFEMLVGGLDHPEGVAYGRDGYLYAGGIGGQIYRIDLKTRKWEEIANTSGFVLGIALDAEHNIYACDRNRHAVLIISPPGKVSRYSDDSTGPPLRTPNYLVFDSRGNLYLSDSGTMGHDDGLIFRIKPGGHRQVFSTELCRFPNGLALNRDETELYVVESAPGCISKVQLDVDGNMEGIEQVVELPGTLPDGLALDSRDNLYISCYRPHRIYVLSAERRLDILVDDPLGSTFSGPTNVAFAGPGLKLFVTANREGRHLTSGYLGVAGQPLNYPVVSEYSRGTVYVGNSKRMSW